MSRQPGARIGPYEVQSTLGAGGMTRTCFLPFRDSQRGSRGNPNHKRAQKSIAHSLISLVARKTAT